MKLIFDIGYNVGRFTSACFQKYPDVKVIGVEANPSLCTGKANNNNLILLNNLVSDVNDIEIDFYIEPKQLGISTASLDFINNSRFTVGSKNLSPKSAHWNAPIKVKSITIDDMIRRYGTPDLIKIDVEGYEYEVIRGLTKKANDICFEWHEENYQSLVDIVNYLMSINYNQFGAIGWFDEGDIFEKLTFSSKGDSYLEYPKNFYSWNELEMSKAIKPNRRVNYGMFFTK